MVSRKRYEKNPSLAALLNFVLWGLGYIYVWRFGHIKSISGLILIILQIALWKISTVKFENPIFVIPSLFFAYDAYKDAKKFQTKSL